MNSEQAKSSRSARSEDRKSVYNGAPLFADCVADDGTNWLEYRKTLVPDYARAWRDAGFCYAMLFGTFLLHTAVNIYWGNIIGFITAPFAAVAVGFWLHALNQFAHEGAHGNMARDRKRNDLLVDWILWPLFGRSIYSYRKSHMQHHVHLGDHADTELSYHQCMSPILLVKSITAVQLFGLAAPRLGNPKGEQLSRTLVALIRAAVIHGLMIGVPIWFGLYAVAAGWLFGLVSMYPFFGTVRPMLEHRAYDALCETDFHDVEHGPVNRLFGEDLFSRYFGAAGTNKHLLHHWDPGISYTRLADMEAFMLRTPCASHINDNRTTYWRAARRMLRTALQPGARG